MAVLFSPHAGNFAEGNSLISRVSGLFSESSALFGQAATNPIAGYPAIPTMLGELSRAVDVAVLRFTRRDIGAR